MSEENVDVVRRGMELWLGGDLEGWRATIDPAVGWDISMHPLPDVPNFGRGRDALATDMLAVYMSRRPHSPGPLRVFKTKAEALEATSPSE